MLNYKTESMDVYQLVPKSHRRWHLTQEDASLEILGRPCSVREVGNGQLATTFIAPVVDEVIEPTTILEVIRGWKQG